MVIAMERIGPYEVTELLAAGGMAAGLLVVLGAGALSRATGHV
jgi:hypothetical protein